MFFGNISYDCEDVELNRTLETVGPFRDMKMIFGEENNQMKPKGYGFCTYKDPDTAASAIRNINKLAINGRDLKVSYCSDKQIGTNLKEDEVRDRDAGEIVSNAGGTSHVAPTELLEPQTSTVDEMIRSLSDDQKEMMIFGI